jgi:hypothetical protein
MGFGSILDVETGGRRFTAVYLNDAIKFSIAGVKGLGLLVGGERTLAPVAGEPELALATFPEPDESGVEVLACMRVKATELVPKTWHEKWRKAVATLRPERLVPADAAALGNWKKKAGVLHGEVLFTAERYLSLNFNTAALAALKARPGDRLLLGIGGQDYALTLHADLDAMLDAMQRRGSSYIARVTDEAWDELTDEWSSAKEADKPAITERMRAHLLPDPPLSACPDKHWYTPDQGILLVQPAAMDRGTFKVKFTLPFKVTPGTPVTLRKG